MTIDRSKPIPSTIEAQIKFCRDAVGRATKALEHALRYCEAGRLDRSRDHHHDHEEAQRLVGVALAEVVLINYEAADAIRGLQG